MTDARYDEIERLIEDAGRCFDPVTGFFESLEEEDIATDLDPQSFLGMLGIREDECAEYVLRKMRDYDTSPPDA